MDIRETLNSAATVKINMKGHTESDHESSCRFQQALDQAMLEQLPSSDSGDQFQGSCPSFYQLRFPLAHDLSSKSQGPHLRHSAFTETQDVTNFVW